MKVIFQRRPVSLGDMYLPLQRCGVFMSLASLVSLQRHQRCQRQTGHFPDVRTFNNVQLPKTGLMPQGPDFCHFPVISEVLNQAADVKVDMSSFDDIISPLPELITKWQDSIKGKMMQVIKKHNTSHGTATLTLCLAWTSIWTNMSMTSLKVAACCMKIYGQI